MLRKSHLRERANHSLPRNTANPEEDTCDFIGLTEPSSSNRINPKRKDTDCFYQKVKHQQVENLFTDFEEREPK